jgi:hypothetical protein
MSHITGPCRKTNIAKIALIKQNAIIIRTRAGNKRASPEEAFCPANKTSWGPH